MGSSIVQTLLIEFKQVRTSEEAISVIVLSLAFRFFVKKRIDLYIKSHMMGTGMKWSS